MPQIDELLQIMARLRDPDSGCPWDLQQDFASISPFTIEEAYEVDQAIVEGDLEALRGELGDLLFQVVFQARLAEEQGAFDFEGVAEAICTKLVRRHPHVFGDASPPGTVEDLKVEWEEMKAVERREAEAARQARKGSGSSDHGGGGSVEDSPPEVADPFEGIPRRLPALARSVKIAGRMARVERARGKGARPPSAGEPELESLIGRVQAALSAVPSIGAAPAEERSTDAEPSKDGGIDSLPRRQRALAVVGEGLQAFAELSRRLGVDPEQALRDQDDARMAAIRQELGRG